MSSLGKLSNLLECPFFNKSGIAYCTIKGKNDKSKRVIFYRKLKENTFTDQEEKAVKEQLIQLAKIILSVCE